MEFGTGTSAHGPAGGEFRISQPVQSFGRTIYGVLFEPTARVRHHHGRSTRQVRPAALLDSHRGLIRYYRKHYRGRIGWLGYTAVTLGSRLTMYPRAALAWIAQRLWGR